MKAGILSIVFLLTAPMVWATEYHVAKTGNDGNKGDRKRPFLTIGHAAAIAVPGDIITVHAGVYPELVSPARGGTEHQRIIYQAAPGEKVTIKGSELIKGWKLVRPDVWRACLPNSYFKGYNPYQDVVYGDWFFPKQKLHTGGVYLNGKALTEAVGQPRGAGEWGCETTKDSTILWMGYGRKYPDKEEVEITVRPSCFYPAKTGINYITVKGFRMSQAATQWAAPTAEQVGIIGTNWSKGWIIENNIISDSKCAGITLGKDRASGQNPWSADRSKDGAVIYNEMVKTVIAEGWNKQHIGSHTVRNNEIYNCGQAGICGSFGAAYSRIIHNHIHDIYTERAFYGAEMAGIKLHGAIDVLIKGNQVAHTFIGIWLDWMAQGTRVSGNLLHDNDYADFFPEVNHGPYLVDNNLFLSPISIKDWSEGGAYGYNLIAGLVSRQPQERQTPYFKPHTTELAGVTNIRGGDNRFYGNIFSGSHQLPMQPKMHGADVPDTVAGYGLSIYNDAILPVKAGGNVYVNGATPFAKEQSPANTNVPFTFQLEKLSGGVYLKFSNYPKAISVPAGHALLGNAIIPQQAFPFMPDLDYFGKKRGNTAGPFNPIPSTKSIRVWK